MNLSAFFLLLLVSCKGSLSSYKANVKVGGIAEPKVEVLESISFDGLKEYSQVTDSTLTLHWDTHAEADAYDLYKIEDGLMRYVTTAAGRLTNQIVLTDLNPGASYRFRLRVRISDKSDANTKDLSVTLNAAPSAPVSMELVSPLVSPGYSDSPLIKISGVKTGDTIKLFSDDCVNEVAQGVASGSSIQLSPSSLPLGSHVFRALAKHSSGATSSCSEASVHYIRQACENGYHLVAGKCVIEFNGLQNATNITDSTVKLNWQSHPLAVAYDLYNTTSGSLAYVTTVIGHAQNSIILNGLIPGATYRFLLRMKTSSGVEDTNSSDLTVNMNAAPEIPSQVTIIHPSYFPTVFKTPTIRIEGVKSGDTVKLYNDEACTQEIGNAIASGVSVDIVTHQLSKGAHTIRARAIGTQQNASACSLASVSYVVSECPENFIPVQPNSNLGTPNEFCVAKFEMKKVGNVAISQSQDVPWVNISIVDAKNSCKSLGAGYDLISNPEWMTIGHNIEAQGDNWTSGQVGIGTIYRGHTDSVPLNALNVTDINNKYDGTGNLHPSHQRRTHVLNNGHEIWDFGGNVSELVDWTIGGDVSPGPNTCDPVHMELYGVNCAALSPADYLPLNPAGISQDIYNSTFGIGRLYGSTAVTRHLQGYARRGGAFNMSDGGLYRLLLHWTLSGVGSSVGFRCVYRP